MFEAGDDVIAALDGTHAETCRAQRRLLSLIVQVDRKEAWRDSGARDTAHWLGMRFGISAWKAHRWVAAASALESLPRLSAAFARGEVGIDKVVELTRFATADTEAGLIRWAKDVSCGTIRHRGDLAARTSSEDILDIERSRSVSWWVFDEGRRFGLEAELPAAQGAIVVRAIERIAGSIPAMPGETHPSVAARRADAFVALCSSRIASDADPDRATVVIHAPIEAVEGAANAETEDGAVVPPQALRRLLCTARTQTVLEDRAGDAVGLGRMTREPSAWMIRQVRYRDRGCRFPACGARAFTEAHHVRWWRHGGRTDLDNLVLICSFHHRLVHEHGWSMRRDADGTLRWFTRDGTRYRAGPSTGAVAEHDPQRTAFAV
jgi:Domain of unknown function (DUF222)/HNH endonuclease